MTEPLRYLKSLGSATIPRGTICTRPPSSSTATDPGFSAPIAPAGAARFGFDVSWARLVPKNMTARIATLAGNRILMAHLSSDDFKVTINFEVTINGH